MENNLDWRLSTCCHRNQWITAGIVGAWLVVTACLWHVRVGGYNVLLPLKLLTIFLHEFAHASACWLTCGRVHAIGGCHACTGAASLTDQQVHFIRANEVHSNEGGVTKTTGGSMWLILPAGYLGSCVWGMLFTLLASINIWTMRVGAGILCFLLVVVLLLYGRNMALIVTCILSIGLVIGAWVATELLKNVWYLRVVLLCIGVMNGIYSLWDIFDDTIRRKLPESDAYKFAQLTHCHSRFCGCLWAVIACAFIVFTFYLLFVIKAVGDETFA